ncbi:MAG: 2-oxo acid dehydrogenase subunit E2 [Haloarculaceae archaeon]
MPLEFSLPDVGEGVAEGEIVQWLVGPGDAVTEDQPLVEVETDKAVVEVPSPVDGTVRELRAEAGDVVPVGDVLIVIDVEGEPPEAAAVESPAEGVPENGTDPAAETQADAGDESAARNGRVFAAPSARRLARELGVDLQAIDGSGPGGRVTEMDVRVAADDAEAKAAGDDTDGTDATASATADTGTAAADDREAAVAEAEEPLGGAQPTVTEGAAPTTEDAGPVPERANRERTLAAPATRKLAADLGVDLDSVPATEERDGEAFVTPETVREYADSQRAAQAADAEAVAGGTAGAAQAAEPAATADRVAPGTEERVPYRGVRRTIGEAMERSKFTAPHVTHHDTVEVSALVDARERLAERADERGIKLTYLPFVVKAVVAALREYPILNSQLDEQSEEIVKKGYYNVGVATATDAGLMVPVIDGAGEKSLLQIASEANELVANARDRSIGREEMQGGTFTITNFGAIGGEYATPIINYPETAILGLGSIEERPVVEDGEVVARPTLPLSLSIDHRVIDGAEAARFANALKSYLRDPTLLLLE